MDKVTKLCFIVGLCTFSFVANGEVAKKNLLDVTKRGSIVEVKKLLDSGVDVNMVGRGGRTALHVASMLGFVEIVELLIAHGANVNCVDDDNATPLHMAVLWFGKENIIEALLRAGADPDIRDKHGTTPLFYAAVGKREGSVDILVAYGASGLGDVLKFAIRNERMRVVKICLEFCDDRFLNLSKFKPLHDAIKTGNPDVVTILLKYGASVELCDERGVSPLRKAVQKGDVKIIKILIKHGADASEKSVDENSLLHDAVWYGASREKRDESAGIYGETINVLLLNGVYVNVRDSHDRTPLHVAAICGMPEIIKIFLAHRADKNAKDRHGKTALDYAKMYKETGVYGDSSLYDKAIEVLTA